MVETRRKEKWKVTLFNISTSSTAKVDVDNTHTHHISLVSRTERANYACWDSCTGSCGGGGKQWPNADSSFNTENVGPQWIFFGFILLSFKHFLSHPVFLWHETTFPLFSPFSLLSDISQKRMLDFSIDSHDIPPSLLFFFCLNGNKFST